MNNIGNTAIKLIGALRNKEANGVISSLWNDLAEHINNFDNYEEIPNIQEVSEALFLYSQIYTNKVNEEEIIRSLITFCSLKRAIDETTGKDKIESYIRLTLLLSRKMIYLMAVMHYTMPQNITNYNPSHVPQLSPERVKVVQKNYEAIKVYIYKNVVKDINDYNIDEDLIRRFNNNSTSFFENSKIETYNVLELTEGEKLLNICYNRVVEYGKYPLFVIKEGYSSFYKKTRGLIKDDFKFQAKTCLLTERGQQYDEAPTYSTFIVRMVDGKLELSITGIKEEFIRPFFSQPISNIIIEKIDGRINVQMEHHVEAIGEDANVPMDLDIVIENGKVVELQFFFIVGKEGWSRYINFYGEGNWLKDENEENALIDDFNFNLDNIIDYKIKERYLPIRAMTADNMGVLGDVAIIGCNPINYNNVGHITQRFFEMKENNETEYFVFPKHSHLYNKLLQKVQSMDAWIPDEYSYKTIKGWILGSLRIVHIATCLY